MDTLMLIRVKMKPESGSDDGKMLHGHLTLTF